MRGQMHYCQERTDVTNRIHPSAVVGEGVELGENNIVGPYTVICGPTVIGDSNWIGPHASIGGPAEYRGGAHPVGWDGEQEGAGVRIGDRNTIREFVTINQGHEKPTAIGDDCYLMGRAHLGHDSVLEDGVTVCSAVQIAGHCQIWPWANLGIGTMLHQRSIVGPGAMVGMSSAVRTAVGAFTITVGNPARATGVNVVGLARRGCDERTVESLAPFVKGKGHLPEGLPKELATLLQRWADRARTE